MKELEDLWAMYEVAKAKYIDAVREARAEAVGACTPLRDEMQRAFNTYHNRSEYLGGRE